jgi:hypothetical protein
LIRVETPVESLPIRRFQVLDAMVLVAATAVGLGAAESLIRLLGGRFPPDEVTPHMALRETVVRVVARLGCLIMSWALALIVLRLRPPRPALRELGARPGFAACLAILLNGLILTSIVCGDRGFERPLFAFGLYGVLISDFSYGAFVSDVVEPISHARVVAIVWTVLALSGARTSEANWIDRAGRALGWLVIGSALGLKVLLWTLF